MQLASNPSLAITTDIPSAVDTSNAPLAQQSLITASKEAAVLPTEFAKLLETGQSEIAAVGILPEADGGVQLSSAEISPVSHRLGGIEDVGNILPGGDSAAASGTILPEQTTTVGLIPEDRPADVSISTDSAAEPVSDVNAVRERPTLAGVAEPTALPDTGSENLALRNTKKASGAIDTPMSQAERMDPKIKLSLNPAALAEPLANIEKTVVFRPTAKTSPNSGLQARTAGNPNALVNIELPRPKPNQDPRAVAKIRAPLVDAIAPSALAALHTEASGQGALTASPVNPIASNSNPAQPMVASVQGTAPAAGTAHLAYAFDQAIENVAQNRELARAARPEVLVRHAEFGLVAMRVEAAAGDLRATLSSRDAGFVPAVQAMLAERAVAASSETNSASHRGSDQSQSHSSHANAQSQGNHSQSGNSQRDFAAFAEARGDDPGDLMSQNRTDLPLEADRSDEGASTPSQARDLFA